MVVAKAAAVTPDAAMHHRVAKHLRVVANHRATTAASLLADVNHPDVAC
jgi:hypothetical protein